MLRRPSLLTLNLPMETLQTLLEIGMLAYLAIVTLILWE